MKSVPFFAPGPHYDAIIDRALRTTDRNEVQRYSAEAMRLIVEDEVIAVPLAGHGRMYVLRNNVIGFVAHPSQLNQPWSAISVKKNAAAVQQ